MPKKADDLQKHTLNLYTGEYARLQELYPEVGAGKVVRELVHAHLKEKDGKVQRARSISIKELAK